MIWRYLAGFIAALALFAAPAPESPLGSKIRALIASSPVSAAAYWGIEIADAATGQEVFKLNSNNFFVPASNTKIFSTALTLSRLGSNFKIETTVQSKEPPDPDGLLSGDLILKGAGDPSLDIDDIEDLASQLYERGIRQINGSVIGDDTMFFWEPYNPGWSIDDAVEGYGAPVSALTLNDNSITLHITPGGTAFEPPVELLTIDNQMAMDDAAAARIHYDRLPGSPVVRLWGVIHSDSKDQEISLGVDDPARFAALVLMDALRRRGVQVKGQAGVRHLFPGQTPDLPTVPFVLARHESAPLLEDLRLTAKSSQNLHAEMYLRLVASQRQGQGSRTGGLDELKAFMGKVGIDQKEYSIQDGSGLSRLNEVTPHALVSLLTYMARPTTDEDWTSILAVGGIDGTLQNRMKSKRLKGRVIAKTGSLSHVSALSGYVKSISGKRYVFSILVNNYNGPAMEIRDVIDKICSVLVD